MPVSQSQKTTTTVSLKCDQCGVETSFVEEDDPTNMPEIVPRFIAVSRLSTYGLPTGTWAKVALCSKFCLLELMKTYEPARKPTPEELAKLKKESEENSAVQQTRISPDGTI